MSFTKPVHRANTYIESWVAVDWTEIKKVVNEIFAARTETKTTINESKLIAYELNAPLQQ